MSEASKENMDKQNEKGDSIVPTRYVVGGMCFLGILLQYLMKVNLSVAIVAMADYWPNNNTNVQHLSHLLSVTKATNQSTNELDVCAGAESPSENKTTEPKEFNWDEILQGHVLSAYYYGYVCTQLLGGRLSEMFGAKIVLGPAVFVSGILTLLSPVCARLHVSAFIAVRVLIGAASGMIIPSSQAAFAKWFPPEERISLGSIMMSSLPLGTIMALSLSGVLAKAGGWPLVFYVFGGISVAWYSTWLLLMYNTPEEHPRISAQERNYILSRLNRQEEEKSSRSLPVPWVGILTSGPFWAYLIMQAGYGWIGYTFLSELPTYLNNILHFDLQESGVTSSLPYVFQGLSMMGAGYLSQWLIRKRYLTKVNSYRIFNTVSAVGSAASVIIVTLVGCNTNAIVILLVTTMATGGAYGGGTLMNHVDLASNFAGTLIGICFTVGNVMGILTPIVTGAIINKQQTRSRWAVVFYISSAISLVSYLICMMLLSADEQPWNRPAESKSRTKKRSKEEKQLTVI